MKSYGDCNLTKDKRLKGKLCRSLFCEECKNARKHKKENILLEKLAEIEHDQWIEWSKAVSETESLSKERLLRWKNLQIPYKQLTEEQKEQDRIYARKVIQTLKDHILTYPRIEEL